MAYPALHTSGRTGLRASCHPSQSCTVASRGIAERRRGRERRPGAPSTGRRCTPDQGDSLRVWRALQLCNVWTFPAMRCVLGHVHLLQNAFASIFKCTSCCSQGQVCTAMFRPSPPRFQAPCRAETHQLEEPASAGYSNTPSVCTGDRPHCLVSMGLGTCSAWLRSACTHTYEQGCKLARAGILVCPGMYVYFCLFVRCWCEHAVWRTR